MKVELSLALHPQNMATSKSEVYAEAYDKVQRPIQGRCGLELMDRLSIPQGSRVLDLGCGTGYLTSVLGERVGPEGRVTGVDPNCDRIRVAKNKYGECRNLEFLEHSSEDFPEGPYDLVFSNCVFHWIKDKETAFRRVSSSLRPGGIFAFLYPGNAPDRLWERLNPEIEQQFNFGTTDEYSSLAQQFGFKEEFKSVDSATYMFESTDVYIEWIQATLNAKGFPIDSSVIDYMKKKFEAKQYPHQWIRIIYILKKV